MYGFMLLVFVIMMIVTACVTIVGTYFLLNAENYHWQWTSFTMSASTSAYVFLYAVRGDLQVGVQVLQCVVLRFCDVWCLRRGGFWLREGVCWGWGGLLKMCWLMGALCIAWSESRVPLCVLRGLCVYGCVVGCNAAVAASLVL